MHVTFPTVTDGCLPIFGIAVSSAPHVLVRLTHTRASQHGLFELFACWLARPGVHTGVPT